MNRGLKVRRAASDSWMRPTVYARPGRRLGSKALGARATALPLSASAGSKVKKCCKLKLKVPPRCSSKIFLNYQTSANFQWREFLPRHAERGLE